MGTAKAIEDINVERLQEHDIEYEKKHGSPVDGDPQVIGKELERIRIERGSLEPDVVVDEVERLGTDSPLYDYFTWDDQEAAKKQRRNEARQITRSVTIKRVDGRETQGTVRAFVHVGTDDGKPGYESTVVAMRDKTERERLLERAKRAMERFEERYGHLEEFADLIDHIEETISSVEEQLS